MKEKGHLHLARTAATWLAAAVCLALLIPAKTPAQAGGDIAQILQELEAYALQLKDENSGTVPGFAYAVVKGSETVYARGFGRRSQYSAADDVDQRTLFEIGSCTKAFNATALGTVVDEKKVSWADRVAAHLPDFKLHDQWVTKEFLVEDLMAQRSGMPGSSLDAMSMMGFGRQDIMHATRFVEPVTSFRSAFAYQNCLHLLVADLVEKKTGLPWEEAVRQRILEPLGMDESTFDFAAYDANPNHAMGHDALEDGSLWTIPSDWPYRSWIAVYAPAGGLCSNVSDMARWVALQVGKGSLGGVTILKPETLQTLRAPRIALGQGDSSFEGVASYANAWVFQSSRQTPWYWHTGKTSGMHSIVAVWPDGELGLVVLTNARTNKIPEKLAQRLLELYFGGSSAGLREGVCPPQPHEGKPVAPAGTSAAAIPPGKLVGTYVNPAYGKVVVKKEGGGISMTMGPAKRHSMLTPSDRNAYCFTWPDRPPDCTTVTFVADGTGAVTKLAMEGFEDVRGGEFKRVNP